MPAYDEERRNKLADELIGLLDDGNDLPWPLERRLASLRNEMVLNHGAFHEFATVCEEARQRVQSLQDNLLLLLGIMDGLRREPQPDITRIGVLFTHLHHGSRLLSIGPRSALLEKLEFEQAGALHQDEGEYKLAARMFAHAARKAHQISLPSEEETATLLSHVNSLLVVHRDERISREERELALANGLSDLRMVYDRLQSRLTGEDWELWRQFKAPTQMVLAHFWAGARNNDFHQPYEQLDEFFTRRKGTVEAERRKLWHLFFTALAKYHANRPNETVTLLNGHVDSDPGTESLSRAACLLLLARAQMSRGLVGGAIAAFESLMDMPGHRIHAAQAVANRELGELRRYAM